MKTTRTRSIAIPLNIGSRLGRRSGINAERSGRGLSISLSLLFVITVYSSLSLNAFARVSDSNDSEASSDTNARTATTCDHYNPLKNVYFGDLHTHTSFSLDAAQFKLENTPDEALAYAKGDTMVVKGQYVRDIEGELVLDENGEPIELTRTIDRPLDFTSITEHAEYLAEAQVCFDKGVGNIYYHSPFCFAMRGSKSGGQNLDLLGFLWLGVAAVTNGNFRFTTCIHSGLDCDGIDQNVWENIQEITNRHNQDCEFSALLGYEWTGTPNGKNQHRNIIFRDHRATQEAISYYDANSPTKLLKKLEADCKTEDGCDAISIPHNPMLGGGEMFNPYSGTGAYIDVADASRRQRYETVVEMFQHKGNSECINDPTGSIPFGSNDELCGLETPNKPICDANLSEDQQVEGCLPLCENYSGSGGALSGDCIEPSDSIRGGLLQGVKYRSETGSGVNPFKFGLIGSTDNHNATPGGTDELEFDGHSNLVDNTIIKRVTQPQNDNFNPLLISLIGDLNNNTKYNPGGLSVVWAEQNTRESIFDALQRKETYATSGTRIVTRTFAGWDFDADLCDDPNWIEKGYETGVPMGGTLSTAPSQGAKPSFIVSALHDEIPLQQIQIVKGWVNEVGEMQEQVFEIAGDSQNQASVNLDTCEPVGDGFRKLCAVWQDENFDSNQNAFYYSKVVENPTCRWSKYQCNAIMNSRGVTCDTLAEDDPLQNCCSGAMDDTIQETAWSSPIWYEVQ